MAVYTEADKKQWIAFYTSPDLKEWKFASRIEIARMTCRVIGG